jgi:pyrroline-5-carboxylate reductase
MRIGFIGAGQMARALASGFVRQGIVTGSEIAAADCMEDARKQFVAAIPGAKTMQDNSTLVSQSEILVLAVKPQHAESVFTQVGSLSADRLAISIVAGLTLDRISAGFQTERLVRVMPNTPCLIGMGACGYCLGDAVTGEDLATVKQLLDAVGVSCQVTEPLMDVVTGLSGSGPAFVYQFIEALSDGAVRMGMPRAIALELAAQTVTGAAQMVLTTGSHPAVLKDQVASPGGTTIAGIDALEQSGFRGTVMSAVRAATDRSRELGQ